MNKLTDPYLFFYESDVRRILKKGYSPQVERGLRLFRLMSKLRTFCEPVGDRVGAACRVRLINFEKLTVYELFDLKGHATGLVPRAVLRFRQGDVFNGLDLLSKEEKILYRKIKKHFEKRKRPTLQRIALDILGEKDERFSERNAYNYLAAARDFHLSSKPESGSGLYYIESVDSFNQGAKTGREMFTELVQRVHRDFVPPAVQVGQFIASVAQPMSEILLRTSAVVLPVAEAIARVFAATTQITTAQLAQPQSE